MAVDFRRYLKITICWIGSDAILRKRWLYNSDNFIFCIQPISFILICLSNKKIATFHFIYPYERFLHKIINNKTGCIISRFGKDVTERTKQYFMACYRLEMTTDVSLPLSWANSNLTRLIRVGLPASYSSVLNVKSWFRLQLEKGL